MFGPRLRSPVQGTILGGEDPYTGKRVDYLGQGDPAQYYWVLVWAVKIHTQKRESLRQSRPDEEIPVRAHPGPERNEFFLDSKSGNPLRWGP